MHTCPACGNEGIAQNAKFYASLLFPATCSSCGKLAGIKSMLVGSLVASMETLILLPATFTGAITPLSTGVLLWGAFAGSSVLFGGLANLERISENSVILTRRGVIIFLVFVLIGTLSNV